MTADGFVAVASALAFEVVVERLQAAVRARGMTVFAVVDHAANARSATLDLRPTTLVMFGDARVGTALMQTAQTLGIDLPHRMLVWSDADGQTWLGYNDPAWLVRRHHADVDTSKMANALAAIAHETANSP